MTYLFLICLIICAILLSIAQKKIKERIKKLEKSIIHTDDDEVITDEVTPYQGLDLIDYFRCNSCNEVKKQPAEFVTKIDLEIPFLDSVLPVHLNICQECLNAQAQYPQDERQPREIPSGTI